MTTILKMYATSLNSHYLDIAVKTLRDGGILLYPTDSLYAIGCNALDNRAIERICDIKGINPAKTNLSIICSDISQASEYARIDNKAFQILKAYVPGPYTFLLPASSRLPKVFKGRKVVGVRIPDNVIARELATRLGNPLLTTSVAMDDEWDVVSAEALAGAYSESVDLVIDGGDGLTVPSTVVDLTDSNSPEIVRQGLGDFEA